MTNPKACQWIFHLIAHQLQSYPHILLNEPFDVIRNFLFTYALPNDLSLLNAVATAQGVFAALAFH
jgi:hypothetical protein